MRETHYWRPGIVRIGMEEIEKAQSPDIIQISPLGPCVGLIIYDPVIKQAIGAHIIDPIRDQEMLLSFLDEVDQTFPDKKRLRVYIGGVGRPGDTNWQRERRSFVEEKVNERGFEQDQVRIRWTDSPQERWEAVEMILDTESGKFEYLVEMHDPYSKHSE